VIVVVVPGQKKKEAKGVESKSGDISRRRDYSQPSLTITTPTTTANQGQQNINKSSVQLTAAVTYSTTYTMIIKS
jgi:hypothetical protein